MKNKYTRSVIRYFYNHSFRSEAHTVFIQWFVNKANQSAKDETLLDLFENENAVKDASTFQDLKKVKKRINAYETSGQTPWCQIIGRIAAAFLILALLGVSFYYYQLHRSEHPDPELVECFVPYGSHQTLVLPDGSSVWLNAGSLVIYEKRFQGKTRTVFLSGEADFSVTPHPDQPFIVKTSDMDIEALGTVFHVESYADSENTIATLESGQVKVDTRHIHAQPSYILSPNEQLIYHRASKSVVRKQVDAQKNNQKKEGYLVFQSSSFAHIMQTIERRYQVRVVYDAGAFAKRTFNVKFLPEEDMNQVLDILKDIGHFTYKIQDQTIYIYP